MSRLGFSIYPDQSTFEEDKLYIDEMTAIGCTRIFSCFLSVGDDLEETFQRYHQTFQYAKEKGLEIYLDTNPEVFTKFGASWNDISFFDKLGVSGLRLDGGFDGFKETALSYNPYDIKIEYNSSMNDGKLKQLLSFKPNLKNIVACHNFYPERFTGLSRDFFDETSREIKALGFHQAAFVGSNTPGAFGPWPVHEGLVTIEDHRGLPLDAQVRQMVAHPDIDDILISNVRPSAEEMEALKKVDLNQLQFKLVVEAGLTPLEKTILFEETHMNRGDLSDYVARSSMPRMKYKKDSLPPRLTNAKIKRGDVMINNDKYGQYKGEVLIAFKDFDNVNETRNVVAHIHEDDLVNLRYLGSWKQFSFID